ncbi:hypothetical protein SDB85_11260 [Legionella pneumophila serogroup 8]
MTWWKLNPILFEQFKEELSGFNDLKFNIIDEEVIVEGYWTVHGQDKPIMRYKIKIIIPSDYPQTIPKIFEIDNLIPKKIERHFNPADNSACLFVKPERWKHWPLGSGIDVFLNGPVKDFFFSQTYYDLTGIWPFGEYNHGDLGIIEYFLKFLNLTNVLSLYEFFPYIDLMKPEKRLLCPCRSGIRFRQCHWERFKFLKDRLPRNEWDELLLIINSQLKELVRLYY